MHSQGVHKQTKKFFNGSRSGVPKVGVAKVFLGGSRRGSPSVPENGPEKELKRSNG